MTTQFTLATVQQAAPAVVRKRIDQDFVDLLNNISTDPEYAEIFKENALNYMSVLKEGKFQMEQYINAVKYVSYKVMEDTNIAAYTKTFPQKYQDFLANGVSDKDIARYVTAYNQSKLVNLIYEQTAIPIWIMNQQHRQGAINRLAHLMEHANSEKVQQESANALLTHLKTPEVAKAEIDITVNEGAGIASLRQTVKEFTVMQQQQIADGEMTAKDVAHSRIIEGELDNDDSSAG